MEIWWIFVFELPKDVMLVLSMTCILSVYNSPFKSDFKSAVYLNLTGEVWNGCDGFSLWKLLPLWVGVWN